MATISPVSLSIAGSSEVGKSDLKVKFAINFDTFDVAAGQRYQCVATLWGDDTNVAGEPNTPDQGISTLGAAIVHPLGSNPVPIEFVRTLPNTWLDEDKPPVPNPDELRAKVSLTPIFASGVGPVESNLVTVNLP